MTRLRLYVDEDSMDDDFVKALRVLKLMAARSAEEMVNQVIFLSAWI